MSRFRPSIVILAIAFATLWACDKMSLVSPTGSTITLTINKTSVPINGTAEVTAAVIESAGTPVQNGTVVTFTSSFGTIEPQEARTNGGTARVTFTGTSSGTAQIGAFSGGAKTAAPLEVKVGGAAASGAVGMRAEPPSLPQNGGTAQIFAIVRDASGNPLPNAPVSFTTNFGTLGSASANTDQNGQAQTSLTTNRDSKVTATVIVGVTGAIDVLVVAAPVITITPPPPPVSAQVPVNFTFTSTPAPGSPVQTVAVDWGDGSGVQNLGGFSGPQSVTHTFNNPGHYTVTATALDAGGQPGRSSVSVAVQRVQPTVALTANPTTVTQGGSSAFTVTAGAGIGGPALRDVRVTDQNGAVVYSGTTGGSFVRQFPSAGTFTFQATATDVAGTTNSATAVVNVTGRAAIEMTLDAASTTSNAYSCFPAASYPKTCTGVDLKAGTQVALNAGFVGAPPSNITGYTWNFGDGTSTTTSTRNTSYTYSGAGTRVVTVTVNTADGGTGSQQITLVVNP